MSPIRRRMELGLQASILFLALIAGLHAIPQSPEKDVASSSNLCQTPECLALSAIITSNMDLTADPCEDFGAYACGNYAKNTLYNPASVSWSEFNEPEMMHSALDSVRDQLSRRVFELLFFDRAAANEDPDVSVMYSLARGLFRSCSRWINKRRQWRSPASEAEASRAFFDGVLTHMLGSIERQPADGSFERALAKMVKSGFWSLLELRPSFRAIMARDASYDGSRMSLSYSVRYPRTLNFTAYAQYLSTVPAAIDLSLENPEEFLNIVRELNSNVTSAIDRYPSQEREMQEVKRLENCSGIAGLLHPGKSDFSIGEMNNLSMCFDPKDPFLWTEFFEAILDGNVDQDALIDLGILGNANNIISLVTYFKQRAINSAPGDKLSTHLSFLVFDWLLSFAEYFPSELAAQWNRDNIKSSRMPSLSEDPIEDCMMLTKKLLSPVVERMYQKSHHEDTFDQVRSLVELVQSATMRSVREQTWITPSAKEAIVEKIQALKNEIGFQELSAQQLKTFYSSTIRSFKAGNYSKSDENFGTMFILAVCANAGRMNYLLANRQDEPPSAFAGADGLIVNAFSFTQKNKIVFPMGILSPFLYHRNYPAYMNLGGIGVIIGHEIGHGFDDMGHELDKQGVSGHFWDNETEVEYLKRMECVKSRYGSYELLPNRTHQSESTVGNDISDLMGIRSAFGAMKLLKQAGSLVRLPNLPASLTPERLFFVQAAQPWCTKAEPDALLRRFGSNSFHSPPHLRIRGMMENSEYFAKVFQCRPQQAMNPSDKCQFW